MLYVDGSGQCFSSSIGLSFPHAGPRCWVESRARRSECFRSSIGLSFPVTIAVIGGTTAAHGTVSVPQLAFRFLTGALAAPAAFRADGARQEVSVPQLAFRF